MDKDPNGDGSVSRAYKRQETIGFLEGKIVDTRMLTIKISEGSQDTHSPHQISEDLYMLLEPRYQAIAHSCSPNAGVRGYNEIVALMSISPGEKITFDYSTVVGASAFDAMWSMSCTCGSKNCRGVIRGIRSLPVDTLRSYIIAGVVPDFILRELVKTVV